MSADAFDIHTAYLSDTGRVRVDNQDSCIELRSHARGDLLVVADGMGGHNGGAVASHALVDCMRELFERAASWNGDMLRDGIAEANERIYRAACETPELQGMGTTTVAVLVRADGQAWVAHVGDCRAYRMRNGELTQLTEDHSVVAELLKHGRIQASDVNSHPQRNEILRSVGVRPDLQVDLAPIDLQRGDWLLLCSDGLSGVISDEEIAAVLRGKRPVDVVPQLIEQANAAGGPDNVTVMVSAVSRGPHPSPFAKLGRVQLAAAATALVLLVGGVWWFFVRSASDPSEDIAAPVASGASSQATAAAASAEPH